MAAKNLSVLHRETADRLGRLSALRFKRDGVYHDLSWLDYRRRADGAAAGLIARGIQAGDRVAILAENSVDWLTADLAVLATGAADVPIHAPSTPKQVEYQLRHGGARALIVSGAAQAAKIIDSLDALPDLEFVVSFQPIPRVGRLATVSWEGLIHEGWREGSFGSGLIGKREATLNRDSLATIIYTSGTTGQPKGVMLTHGNLLSNAEATCLNNPLHPDDLLLSWLPYSHIYARTVDHYLSTFAGVTVCLAESPESLVVNLAETQPTWMTAVPRFYEKVWASVEGLAPASRAATLSRIFGPRLRQLTSGGAPLPKHVAEGYLEAGMPLYEGYGLTESSPVISFNSPAHHKPGSVGRAIPGVEVTIAPDGEILTRGPHVMKGYWKDEAATQAAIVDGWLHTGDVGRLDDDGFLTITDRKKDLIITSGGKNLAPSELERLLVRAPLVDQAVVFGDRRPFASALIVPNFERLRAELGPTHGAWRVSENLITDKAALALVQREVDEVMRQVSQPERVKAVLVLARPFAMETEELTSTMKIRRSAILTKYREPIDALYARAANDRGGSGNDPSLGGP